MDDELKPFKLYYMKLSPKEQELLEFYRSLNDAEKEDFKQFLNSLENRDKSSEE